MSRRERRRAVAGENPIGRVADVFGQAASDLDLARLRVDEHAKHLAADAAGEDDVPAQPQGVAVDGKPDEFRFRFARKKVRGEFSILFGPAGDTSGGDRVLIGVLPDVPRGNSNGAARGNRRRGEQRTPGRGR
jgi:hypothetical protein